MKKLFKLLKFCAIKLLELTLWVNKKPIRRFAFGFTITFCVIVSGWQTIKAIELSLLLGLLVGIMVASAPEWSTNC